MKKVHRSLSGKEGFQMKNFQVTVNGQQYTVAVEELDAEVSSVGAPVIATTPMQSEKKEKTVEEISSLKGKTVEAPMPGTILKLQMGIGDVVKQGDSIMVLEAMKMENDIVAPCDGTIGNLLVKAGDGVQTNQVLATIV